MFPKPVQQLIDLLAKLPGIGPRQAARFAFFLLKDQSELTDQLADALKSVTSKIQLCAQCFRLIESAPEIAHKLCEYCRDQRRDQMLITVVEKESDMLNLEKTGVYNGTYHVLGGVISPLDSESPKKLHLRELHDRVKNLLEQRETCEVVLGTNPTTEGDTTALYLERILSPLKNRYEKFKLSRLARGLSLGSELEYADEITLRNALVNRK